MIIRVTPLGNPNMSDVYIMVNIKMGTSKFIIRKSEDNQFYFVLEATNGEVIATSEMYTTKDSCLNGIDSVRRNAPIAVLDDQTKNHEGIQ